MERLSDGVFKALNEIIYAKSLRYYFEEDRFEPEADLSDVITIHLDDNT